MPPTQNSACRGKLESDLRNGQRDPVMKSSMQVHLAGVYVPSYQRLSCAWVTLLRTQLTHACPGAIFGIGGALAVFCYRHKEFFGSGGDAVLKSLGQNLAMNVVYGLVAPNIDNW